MREASSSLSERAGEGVTPDLLDRFRSDLAPLLAPDATLLVAVSGGPDSMALLLLARAALGDRCVAATVDHGLRPESAGEAGWVAERCAERGIRHRTLTAPLPARSGRTANLSARARDLRYRLLEEARVALGAAAVATGHHADDQLETMVMRLNRGAGVGGLAGVRARTGTVIRPLLGWRRADLAALVTAAGLVPVADPTNTDERFDRARLRKALAGADWLDPAAASRSAAALADADGALDWTVRELAARCCTLAPESAHCRPPRSLPPELQRRLVRLCVSHVAPAAEPRGDSLSQAIRSLGEGRTITISGVMAAVSGPANAPLWHFRPAPPRRSR